MPSLKTLEEPTQNVVFILATTELHKIPATILSRVQRFEFKSIKTYRILREHIHHILEKKISVLNQRLWKSLLDGLKVGMRGCLVYFGSSLEFDTGKRADDCHL